MASHWYNRGLYRCLAGTLDWTSGTYGLALVTSSYVFNADHATMSSITNELSGGSYSRQTISSGKTVTQDDTNDRAYIDADNITFSTLGAAAGTPAMAIVYRDGASDAARDLICAIELTTPPTPNGQDYTIVFPATGVARLNYV